MMDLDRLEGKHTRKKDETHQEWFERSWKEARKNPIKKIKIKPTWYDLRGDIFDFIEQLLTGYLWEVKFGTSFIAKHPEESDVRYILDRIASFKRMEADKKMWWPSKNEEEDLLMYEFARLMPKLWD